MLALNPAFAEAVLKPDPFIPLAAEAQVTPLPLEIDEIVTVAGNAGTPVQVEVGVAGQVTDPIPDTVTKVCPRQKIGVYDSNPKKRKPRSKDLRIIM